MPDAPVPANATGDDLRSAKRLRALKSARLVSRDRRSTWDCTVRDLSAAGARIRLDNALFIPAEVTLMLLSEGTEVPCVVRWRREREIGVRFVPAWQAA